MQSLMTLESNRKWFHFTNGNYDKRQVLPQIYLVQKEMIGKRISVRVTLVKVESDLEGINLWIGDEPQTQITL